jgi:hypothetical protein
MDLIKGYIVKAIVKGHRVTFSSRIIFGAAEPMPAVARRLLVGTFEIMKILVSLRLEAKVFPVCLRLPILRFIVYVFRLLFCVRWRWLRLATFMWGMHLDFV